MGEGVRRDEAGCASTTPTRGHKPYLFVGNGTCRARQIDNYFITPISQDTVNHKKFNNYLTYNPAAKRRQLSSVCVGATGLSHWKQLY